MRRFLYIKNSLDSQILRNFNKYMWFVINNNNKAVCVSYFYYIHNIPRSSAYWSHVSVTGTHTKTFCTYSYKKYAHNKKEVSLYFIDFIACDWKVVVCAIIGSWVRHTPNNMAQLLKLSIYSFQCIWEKSRFSVINIVQLKLKGWFTHLTLLLLLKKNYIKEILNNLFFVLNTLKRDWKKKFQCYVYIICH